MFVKQILGNYFINKRVLDVGSGDINGNNRFLFENCEYYGNDVIQAHNVTIVSKTKDLPFMDNTFDTIISTECFEHDKMWGATIMNCISLLKSGGLFLFTCATPGRPEHGTSRSGTNWASPFTTNTWGEEYYMNLTEKDIRTVFYPEQYFSEYEFSVNEQSKDLYFYGIKK